MATRDPDGEDRDGSRLTPGATSLESADTAHDPGSEIGLAGTMESGELAAGSVVPVMPGRGTTDLPPGTMVGEYRVEGKLGAGGMGVVFAATHPLIGKKAAVKVLKPELCASAAGVERFVQEARAVNQIGHPNIVDIFSFGTLADGRSYFVMEWLRGESLQGRIKRQPLSQAEALDILEAVCAALAAAHDKGIVHRDLKPENVFLVEVKDREPLVKLLDFGIAKLTGSEDTRMEKTATGHLLGTPLYISPEQARGQSVDARADIYSLGAMAFEMLSGQPPFVGESAMDVVARHLNDPPPRLSSVAPRVPAGLSRLIGRMLEKERTERPTLAEVRAGFAEARAAGPEDVAKTHRGKRRVLLAVVGTVVVLGGVCLWWEYGRSGGGGTGDRPQETGDRKPEMPDVKRPWSEGPLPARVPAVVKPLEKVGGQLILFLKTEGARVEIDGKVVKEDMFAFEADGEHEVKATRRGFKPFEERVEVKGGQTVKVDVTLVAIKRGGGGGKPPPDPDSVVDPFGGAKPKPAPN
ncbi:MAG TPA: serine/threonine-protein kinase [Kofleriaceae bacterium]|nr:serine/threonine-protein kinase [Kofleriaceae bacterium]